MRTILSALFLLCLGHLPGTVSAAPPGPPGEPPGGRPVFSAHDLDRDGFIDRREYYGFRQRLRAREGPHRQAPRLHRFDEFDRDRDGRIDHDEMIERLQGGAAGEAAGPRRSGPAPPAGR